jgi:cytochrome c
MNPYFVLVGICTLLIIACHPPVRQQKQGVGSTSATDSLINYAGMYVDSPFIAGAKLVAANDCLTCHRINEKNVGPSFMNIAAKYGNNNGNIENLTTKVITGGKGLWGTAAMTPHPNVQYSDVAQMVRFILSLKKK